MTVSAGVDDARLRLDQFLVRHGAGLSRSRIQALIRSGQVAQDGRTIMEPNHRVNEGDVITVTVPPAEPAEPGGEAIALTVVHEDAHLIVIDKPAGLVVHPGAGNWSGTLVNALIAHCGDSLSGIGGVRRPGIVHRLDKETSGLLVVAKSDVAHQGLAAQFADHGRTGPLERAYLALVWGVPERRSGSIDAPLGRAGANRLKQAVRREGGREAITHYEVIEEFAGGAVSLAGCRLETGRTHQIRVHMAHIRHPLLGDSVYGAGFETKASKLPEPARALVRALGRQALHAAVLGFEHPVTGAHLRFESALPADLSRIIEAMRAAALEA